MDDLDLSHSVSFAEGRHANDRSGARPLAESYVVPFQLPTGLADGLGLESGLRLL